MFKKYNGKAQGLWTRNFTIITIGSAVSMIGGSLSGFILGIKVLDYTGSTLLYSIYQACYSLPYLICPIIAGPFLDRTSRKNVIYRLDYLSSALFLTLFLVPGKYFSYPMLLLISVMIGSFNSIYLVAYDSLYPNLIPQGYYSKAYSVASILGSVSMAVTPVAAFIYDSFGSVKPLFAFNALCFFTAACFERTIKYDETHISPSSSHQNPNTFFKDLKDGIKYLAGEKGLLFITLYFIMCNMMGSAGSTLWLPFFRNNGALFSYLPISAVTLYSVVTTFSEIGRIVGGAVNYRIEIPSKQRFNIAFTVYICIALIDAFLLYLPVPAMAIALFFSGFLAVTSYNIRASATQAYVPDSKRARFNGIYSVTTSIGTTIGTLMAGAAASHFSERTAVLIFGLLWLLSVFVIMLSGRKYVSAVYSIELKEKSP